jgi:ATP-binding cassette subfamily B protein
MSFASICKAKMIMAVIFAILSVFGGMIPYIGVYGLIQLAILNELTSKNLLLWCSVCAGGFILQIVCYAISTTFAHVSAYTILEQIRLKMAQRLLQAPLGEITSQPAGKLKDIFLDKVGTIELPLAHVIPEVGSSLLLPAAMFIYLISIDWRMALATLATLPICILPMLSGKARDNFNKNYTAYMQANDHVNNVIVEYIEGIEVVKTFNQAATSYEKFAGAVKSFKDFTLSWFLSSWKTLTVMSTVLPTTLLATVPVGLVLFINGTLNVSELTICCILALGLVAPLVKFTTYVNLGKTIEYAILSANELLELPELPDSKTPKMPREYSISLKNVSFSYTGQESDNVLHKINLEIPQDKVTALVGPSGGGKSTVAKLIDRFWDVSEGSIRIGGIDIREIPLAELSKMVSFVTQDNFLFNCSLKENIRLGNPAATDEEVFRAARAARCEEFINRLGNGWDTSAGEAGKHLSGGEKQRISIARAILKNAPIVILDEATAFTDPENEDKIQQSIMQLARGKTLLVIAHRLSTIKNADQIAVIEKGSIVAVGRQKGLLRTCPLYQRLWNAHVGARQWAVTAGGKEARADV